MAQTINIAPATLSRVAGRRTILLLGVLLVGLFLRYSVLPLWNEWTRLRHLTRSLSDEHSRLVGNLAMRATVDAEFNRLPAEVFQRGSDQATLSIWLRELESLARHPGIFIVNMRAQPVRRGSAYSVYGVKLNVSGRLPEVVRFVSAATRDQAGIGIEGFQLRGAHSDGSVECLLTLQMTTLRAAAPDVRQVHSESQDVNRQ